VFIITPVEQNNKNEAVTFKDIPSSAITVKPRPHAISSNVAGALNNYVDFINETLRQVKYLQLMLRNYNSSANYYKTSQSSEKARVTYTHENFKIPQTAFYKALNESKSIPTEYQKPLNDQHEVLMSILKEMDALGIELDEHTHSFKYRDDNFKRSDEILKRCKELITLIDGKKEKLYNDVNKIYYSYQPVTSNKSWYTSVKALTEAVDLSKKQLYESKDFLAAKNNVAPPTEPLREQSRALIVEEYTNMDGIKRLGRSNGLCPYTPYENIAEATGRFAGKIDNLKRGESKDNERSYEDLIYIYNSLIDDYNKFTDLNPLEDLRNIHQINVIDFPSVQPTPQLAQNNVPKKEPEKRKEQPQSATIEKPSEGQIVKHDTITIVKELKTEIVKRDTVFIEKSRTDTVYIRSEEDDENLLSLEGYANNNIVLLLDVSSSMEAPHKLPLLKKSVKQLIQIYRPEDEISVVLYSGKAKVALEPTSGSEKQKILDVIDNLKSEGSTDANAGLRLAYKVADENYKRGGNNRVILATDGEFKISGSSLNLVEGSSQNDIYLTVFNYTDQQNIIENLKQLSEKGKGNYENITFQNADIKMVKEAKAKKRADSN
jgi:Mg-chelatase subunit ChlD